MRARKLRLQRGIPTRAPLLPVSSPIQDYLDRLHQQLAGLTSGQVATYIPELAKADPSAFGIVLATVDGRVYEVGDARRRFTLQSISKPLVYGVALEDRGLERVRRAVGVEPSGEAFNSISLEAGTGRPLNPMINAGAIAVSSLIDGPTAESRLSRVVKAVSTFAGRPLAVDNAVFESERSTGHRNRAIGHLLRNYDILLEDPDIALDLYFRQCSLLVDCHDLALMAATLANGGVNPVTRDRAVAAEFVGPILSVMTTCGVYDFTGEWVYRVGLPAKSGVGGGIMAVLPGQLGIGVFSPPLDEQGNSVRGVRACEAISRDLGLHFLQPPKVSGSIVRASSTLAAMRSKRRRTPAEERVLSEHGGAVRIYELQGDLRFSTIEPVLHDIVAQGDSVQSVVLDFKRVSQVDRAATRMLAALISRLVAGRRRVVLTRVRRGDLLTGLEGELDPLSASALNFQPQLDQGLEWCERALLKQHGIDPSPGFEIPLAEHGLCAGLSPAEVAALEAQVVRASFEPGALLLRRGDPADALYVLLRGDVSVVVDLPGGGQKRLSSLSAGMSFGEQALLAGGVRSAHVRADTPVTCCMLFAMTFAGLEREHPALALRLMRNLLHVSTQTVVRLTADVAALDT